MNPDLIYIRYPAFQDLVVDWDEVPRNTGGILYHVSKGPHWNLSFLTVFFVILLKYSQKLTSLYNPWSSPLSKGKLSSLKVWQYETRKFTYPLDSNANYLFNLLLGKWLRQWKIILQWDLSQPSINLLSLLPSLPISWEWPQ